MYARTTRLALATGAALTIAASPAVAEPVAVTSATLNWSQANVYNALPARTFLGHTTNPGLWNMGRSNGTAVVSDGATVTSPSGATLTEVGPTSPRGLGEFYAFGFPSTSGTIDRAAKTLKVQTSGALTYIQYPAMPTPPAQIKLSGLLVELSGTSGAVYASVAGPAGAAEYPSETTTPLFTLSASNAQTTDLGNGRVVISNLVPTLQRANVFGTAGQYAPGTAGPDRTPNTFGTFSLTIDTKPATPAPTPTVIEKTTTVEKTTTLEKIVEVDRSVVLRKLRLRTAPFSRTAIVDVNLTARGKTDVIAQGFVAGQRLWVITPKGTSLRGQFTLRRTSGSKRLPKTKNVTITAATAATKSRK